LPFKKWQVLFQIKCTCCSSFFRYIFSYLMNIFVGNMVYYILALPNEKIYTKMGFILFSFLIEMTDCLFWHCGVGGVDFWIFWIFDLLQLILDLQNNSNAKVAIGIFLYFHVFLCGNEFFGSQKVKITK
jgi:hypothetical protein